MILNKKIFAAIIVIFLVYTSLLVIYFNSNINRSFNFFQIEKQKELVSLSLSYNKRLYETGNDDQKKDLVKEYKFINEQQAYLSLLGYFKNKIVTGIIVSTVIVSLISITILFTVLVILVKQFLYPFQQVILSLDNYLRHKKVNKIRLQGNREIKNFLSNFNDLIEKLIKSRVEEKIKSSFQNWQTLAKIIVHEIKNQISPVNLNLESLIYYNEELHLKNGLENIRSNLDSIEKIVNNFRNLSNLPEPLCANLNITVMIKDTLNKLGINRSNFSFINEETNIVIYSDKFYLELIFINLLKNARESNNTDELKIVISYESGDTEKIIISDNGSGIPEDVMPKIFKPGFTTKSSGDGIGLFLVKELCNCLDIGLDVRSSDKGTSVVLVFENFKKGTELS